MAVMERYSCDHITVLKICARALNDFMVRRPTEDEASHIPKRAVIKKRTIEDAEQEEGEVHDDSYPVPDKARHERAPSAARNGKSMWTPALGFKVNSMHV